MKSFLFLAFCFFLMSCRPAQDCKDSGTKEMKEEGAVASGCDETSPSPGDSLPAPDGEVPTEAFSFDASIKFENFEVEQEEKVHKAVEVIKKVISSTEFRTKVINYTYNGKRAFIDNGGLTNEQVYQKVLEGSEKLVPDDDFEMDVELELYYSSKNTVGYTYQNTVKIWMNTKFFNPYTPSQVAGNLFHEWTHKLGFTHATSYSAARESSVPYALGYLIRDLGKKYE